MKPFIVKKNNYLKKDVIGFYHTYYTGHNKPDNPNYINTLKNTFDDCPKRVLINAKQELSEVLKQDFPAILALFKEKKVNLDSLTVCVIPRAKAQNQYSTDQLLFKETVRDVVNELPKFYNGIDFIKRHSNTKTTHLQRAIDAGKLTSYDNSGSMPYEGITNDTCNFSDKIRGKNILLIDDIYTKSINIDEDAIQALLDKGAKNVIFYAVAKTI